MDKTAVLEIINQFKTALESRSVSVNKIILFGSYMTGKFKEGSDIDLVIIPDDFKNKSYWERIDIFSDVIYEVFKPIEAVALTSDTFQALQILISEGLIPRCLQRFRSKSLVLIPRSLLRGGSL